MDLNYNRIDSFAWNTGESVNNGKNWKVKEYDTVIGATNGKETRYVRIECS